MAAERKPLLLRLDPAIHEALQLWARDELRSVNAQIEFALRDALARAGRIPARLRPPPTGAPTEVPSDPSRPPTPAE